MGSDSPNRADRWAPKSIICKRLSGECGDLLGVRKPTMNRSAATLAVPTLRRTCADSEGLWRSARHAALAMELSKEESVEGGVAGLASRSYR
jgi:hypothetical protein